MAIANCGEATRTIRRSSLPRIVKRYRGVALLHCAYGRAERGTFGGRRKERCDLWV